MSKDEGLGLLLLIAAISIGGAPISFPKAEAPPITQDLTIYGQEEAPIIQEEATPVITFQDAPIIQDDTPIGGILFIEAIKDFSQQEYLREEHGFEQGTGVVTQPEPIAGTLFKEAIETQPQIEAPEMPMIGIAGSRFLFAIR